MTGHPGARRAIAYRSSHPVAKWTPSRRRSISPKHTPARMRSRARESDSSASTGCCPSSRLWALDKAFLRGYSRHTAKSRIPFSLCMPRPTEARKAFTPTPSRLAASLCDNP